MVNRGSRAHDLDSPSTFWEKERYLRFMGSSFPVSTLSNLVDNNKLDLDLGQKG